MNILLIAMPWALPEKPSPALGALCAYLRQKEPRWEVNCRSEYLHVAERLGFLAYRAITMRRIARHHLGEILYITKLFPDEAVLAKAKAEFRSHARAGGLPSLLSADDPEEKHTAVWDEIGSGLDDAMDDLCSLVARSKPDLVGLTVTFDQMFASLALARRLSELTPAPRIVLGGCSVAGTCGPTFLREFPFVDYVVQGEGEAPLLALGRALEQNDLTRADHLDRVISRLAVSAVSPNPVGPVSIDEIDDLDELPLPDYDEYAAAVAAKEIATWEIPIEGSRGCWWDRTWRTGDPRQSCYFCTANISWRRYRKKSVQRLVAEMNQLADKYQRTEFGFLDNIVRTDGLLELAQTVRAQERDYGFFHEIRAHIRPWEVLKLWEAGLNRVQIGIEALSSALLQRMGKGTTTIQNLQAMKTCQELRIDNVGNLIFDFPGSTAAEVEETVRNIRDYASGYQPCMPVPFVLEHGSTVDRLREEYGLRNIRNLEGYRLLMPEGLWERLIMPERSFDGGNHADWREVRDACQEWQRRYWDRGEYREQYLLYYHDGRSFLRIVDRRQGHATFVVDGLGRSIYLFCMEVRPGGQVLAAFAEGADAEEVQSALDSFVAERLMFREGDKYLSLACATTPEQAARRITAAQTR